MSTMIEVLNDWYVRVDIAQKAHYKSANRLNNLSYWFGVPTIALTLFVGTSVFASLQARPSFCLQVTTGICSVLAAILAGLQTFFRYAERSEQHRVAAAKFGAIGRDLEVLRASENPDLQSIELVKTKLNALAVESPIAFTHPRSINLPF